MRMAGGARDVGTRCLDSAQPGHGQQGDTARQERVLQLLGTYGEEDFCDGFGAARVAPRAAVPGQFLSQWHPP